MSPDMALLRRAGRLRNVVAIKGRADVARTIDFGRDCPKAG